jgi:hypothetical protein
MSAHSVSQRRSRLSTLVAQVSEFVFEPLEETIEPERVRLEPQPVVAIVSAAPRSGATTVARLLAAELAGRADGAAVIASHGRGLHAAPPSRAALRLATALRGAVEAQPCGRLCVVGNAAPAANADGDPIVTPAEHLDGGRIAALVDAARYLAPVVVDVPPDGSAASVARLADRVAVVAPAAAEPALVDAIVTVLGCNCVKAVSRIAEPGAWTGRADVLIPDARLGVRAAAVGTKAMGALGAAICELVEALDRR